MDEIKVISITPFQHSSNPRSSKARINLLVTKQLSFHYRRHIPVNSSMSSKLIDQGISADVSPSESYPSLQRSSSQKSIKSISSQSPKRPNISTETERPKRKTKYCCIQTITNPTLVKHKEFFDMLREKEVSSSSLPKSRSLAWLQKSSMIKTGVERNLHEEYMKDRDKFKLGNGHYISNKKVWKPDCLKTLRKADKLLSTLPKIRS